MPGRARANGEGSIFPYRTGFAAYVWVTKPDGQRTRKYVYGKTRDAVHDKWIKLHQQAKAGAVATSVPTVGSFLAYWLTEIIEPNRAPLTLRHLQDIRPPLPLPWPRLQAPRPAPGAGRADLAQSGGPYLPVLRPGQGRRPSSRESPLLRGRAVLPGSPVDAHGQRHPGRAAGRPHPRPGRRPHQQESGRAVALATVRRRRGRS